MIDQILQVLVLLAGFMNAGMLWMQGSDLQKSRDSTGVSLKMFVSFIAFQAIFALNGYRHDDVWQTAGMVTSMLVTIWVISLIIRFRPQKPGAPPQP